MSFALNLADDGRILSATYPEYAPEDAVIVEALPEGDISNYIYKEGEYVYDPLPVPEEPEEPEEPATPDDTSVWDELDAAYREGVDSV